MAAIVTLTPVLVSEYPTGEYLFILLEIQHETLDSSVLGI